MSRFWRVEFKRGPAISLEFGSPSTEAEVRLLYPRAVKIEPQEAPPGAGLPTPHLAPDNLVAAPGWWRTRH